MTTASMKITLLCSLHAQTDLTAQIMICEFFDDVT
jgi:hypothetical protein